jgi:hypothetical protein
VADVENGHDHEGEDQLKVSMSEYNKESCNYSRESCSHVVYASVGSS